jgi:DSF synthase
MNTVVDFQLMNNTALTQVRTRFEEEFGVMTYYMNPAPRPCFNKVCMSELHQSQSSLEKMQGEVIANGKLNKANYLVLGSDVAICLSSVSYYELKRVMLY